jgi:hypothetical protein
MSQTSEEFFEKTLEYDPDWNPQDNDIFFEESAFIQHLIQFEPKEVF